MPFDLEICSGRNSVEMPRRSREKKDNGNNKIKRNATTGCNEH